MCEELGEFKLLVVFTSMSFFILRRKSQTFQDHAHVLVDLIRQCKLASSSTACIVGIMEYVIASSYRRMQRQIKSKYSVIFLEALFSVKDFQMTSPPNRAQRIGNTRTLLEILPSIASRCDIRIPRLLHITCLSANLSLADFYNNETCTEFHRTLCALLRGFRVSLDNFAGCHFHDVAVRPPKDSESESLQEAQPFQKVLESLVSEIRFYASCLHTIVYSPLMRIHLSTIANLLEQYALDNHVNIWSGEENSVDDLSNDLELFAQPYTSQTRSPRSVVKSYLKWLRLTVQHVEAIYVALRAFHVDFKEPIDFSIKILTVPSQEQDTEMTPWRRLVGKIFLRDPTSAENTIRVIDLLRSRHKYFESAFGDKASLSTGYGFLGCLHCIAYMTSIISVPSTPIVGNDLKDLLHEYIVSSIMLCFIRTHF
jgi:hypothetical protein